MSANDDRGAANGQDDPAANAGDLGELIPESLLPVWRRIETIQAFRKTYGDRYTGVLEVLTALALTAGYLYWLFLYLTA
ncbi:hypothetical protein BG842_02275 [Haladaptatus sp. W1]|uniref:hypothetical protein n=1 Tax=Haladaptatus sp. W1 TaxID=1897478 RepID=UPI000849E760|nr:hypothetical protein [Haladaptatus sp. W1]ODR80394.1 hypothetical protein BG842_02275 [Haladaptatus sp. W1]